MLGHSSNTLIPLFLEWWMQTSVADQFHLLNPSIWNYTRDHIFRTYPRNHFVIDEHRSMARAKVFANANEIAIIIFNSSYNTNNKSRDTTIKFQSERFECSVWINRIAVDEMRWDEVSRWRETVIQISAFFRCLACREYIGVGLTLYPRVSNGENLSNWMQWCDSKHPLIRKWDVMSKEHDG